MNFLSHYGMFLLQTFTLVIAALILVGGIVAIAAKSKGGSKANLKVTELNKQLEKNKQLMLEKTLDKKALNAYNKAHKKQQKKSDDEAKPRLFVINFVGDIKASAVENLRKEVTAILSISKPEDEVLVNLESGGGTVNSYGLGASQLQRLTDKGIPLTVSVDKIAASGGYLMASVANKILAAPFAIIGSIGVVAQLPNFHRFLKKHDIDFELMTAGEYKRTLTMFGENTPKAREKFNEDLDSIHICFKDHISEHRKQVAIDKVATGEYWLAKEAFELNLVDKLTTSDQYVIDKAEDHKVIEVANQTKNSMVAKILKPVANILNF